MHQVQRRSICVAAGAAILFLVRAACAQDYTPWTPPDPYRPPVASGLSNLTGRTAVAAPPVAPTAPSRGDSWPGGRVPQPPGDVPLRAPEPSPYRAAPTADYQSPGHALPGSAAYQSPPVYPVAESPAPITFPAPKAAMPLLPCENALMLAAVATEAILARDVVAAVEENVDRHMKEQLAKQRKKLIETGHESDIPRLEEETEAEKKRLLEELRIAINEASEASVPVDRLSATQQSRRKLLEGFLKAQIDLKLAYYDAKRSLPKDNLPAVEKQLTKAFNEAQLPKLLADYGVESHRDLDNELRKRGSSLEQERRLFAERNLAHQWIQQQVEPDQEVSFQQMVNYYREHPTEFDKPANTRWQMLSVSFSRYPDRREARARIAAMGNRALQGGDFEQVAKEGEVDGAPRDWPDESARVPDAVKLAIEGLPAGQMSQILEDWRGYYIVRVVERTPAHRQSFEVVQSELREKIKQNRSVEQMDKYLAKLRAEVPVWTVLDATSIARKPERLQY